MELNQYYKNKINELSTYLCNPLIKKDEVMKYCYLKQKDIYELNLITIKDLTNFINTRNTRYKIILDNFRINKQSLPPEELYQQINLSKYSIQGIYGLFSGIIVKSWLYGSIDFALIMKIFISIMSKLNNEWRNVIEQHLIIYNGVNRICHRLECHCINFDYCKHENDTVWNNIFEQELFDIDSHIGKDDFTILDALVKISKNYDIPDPRKIIPDIFPEHSVITLKKKIPWQIERLLWIAYLKEGHNNLFRLPKDLIHLICYQFTMLYRI